MAFLRSVSLLTLRRRLGGIRQLSSDAAAVDGRRIVAAGYHVAGGPSFMRGMVFREPNRPLAIEEFHMPRPKAGELLIKTKGDNWDATSPVALAVLLGVALWNDSKRFRGHLVPKDWPESSSSANLSGVPEQADIRGPGDVLGGHLQHAEFATQTFIS